MNAVQVEVFHHLLAAIAEEMGVLLRRAAFSANIKERLDLSCALTDRKGAMIAQASHIPVHLGSSHLTARHILNHCVLEPGDMVVLNDPWRGGTHLPDITLFAPVFVGRERKPSFGVMTRAHHADVGGGVPGSMGSFQEIFQEGLIIPPVKLLTNGRRNEDVMALILANVRTPRERRGDLEAQIAATTRGVERVLELCRRYTVRRVCAAGDALKARAARAIREVISQVPRGRYSAEDTLDGPGTPKIVVTLDFSGEDLEIDFTGSSPAVRASLNAHEAITLSTVFYVLRCLADESIPSNSGVLEPVRVKIPPGTIVGAVHPSPVAGGNVETSQRLVDVLFAALSAALPDRVPAASQGTMNSLSFGGEGKDGRMFTYYETIAGGCGAGPLRGGASGLHSHMTNTLNTPIEALEREYPVRVTAYHLRRNSGGSGLHRGGDGVVREIEALVPMNATILSTRRAAPPPGAQGGRPGKAGKNSVLLAGRRTSLAAADSVDLAPGDQIRIETPGGGGFGAHGS